MTDLTQMIRWQTNFVRGLAQSVLERAKNIRETLEHSQVKKPAIKVKAAKKAAGSKKPVKKSTKGKTKRKHG